MALEQIPMCYWRRMSFLRPGVVKQHKTPNSYVLLRNTKWDNTNNDARCVLSGYNSFQQAKQPNALIPVMYEHSYLQDYVAIHTVIRVDSILLLYLLMFYFCSNMITWKYIRMK